MLCQLGVFFCWFPNSPELGTPAKSCSQNEPLKNKPGEVKWQTVFLEQNMCVKKNVRKNNSVAPFVGGSAFIQSVTQEPEWVYALLLGIEGVLIVIWGSVSRSRILFVGGVLIFAIDVIYQVTSLLSHLGGAMVGVIFGSLIIVLVVLAERFRGKLSILVDRFTKN